MPEHHLFFPAPILMMFMVSCGTKNDSAPASSIQVSETKTDSIMPANPPPGFKHQFAEVNGVKIHYVMGGSGDPLVLLHGFGQNWFMWNRLLPELSKHFTIIAPDLRGMGEAAEFIRAFSVPGSTTACFHWFGNFPQDALDNHIFEKIKLQMPVLAMGAEYGSGSFLAKHTRVVATNVTEVIITGSGHWIVQEKTEQVQKALLDFFVSR